jgi:ribosomal protein S18 acetylase RimI-like enzyme
MARPWNDEIPDPALRLERGSHEFLRAVAELLGPRGSGPVYSPALYPSATKVWTSAGFTLFRLLDVMELTLGTDMRRAEHVVEATTAPDWRALVAIDRLAFDGFWRMSEAGLVEAMKATPRATVLTARVEDEFAGYSLVGSQLTASYLQRVAVAPSFAGQGIGGSLVRASAEWASKRGSRALVLNLRPENDRARRLYEREGFQTRETPLHLLRYEHGE